MGMKASITLEYLTKGLEKAERAAKFLDKFGRAADKAEREGRGLARTEDRLARSNDRLARSEDKTTRAFHKSTEAARRQKNALLALEKQQDRLARKARQGASRPRDQRGRYIPGGGGRAGGGGLTALFNPVTGVATGAGAGFISGMGLAAGAGAGGAGAVGALTVRAAARDEFTRDQLRVLGEYTEAQERAYDRLLKKAGRKRGIGTSGAYNIFGELMAGGLSHGDAAAMTDGVAIFSKATQAQVDEAARTTIALRNNLGITNDQMMRAYDTMNAGGKAGQFEVRDMAKSFPSLAAKMEAAGEAGLQGVKGLVAMAQAIRTTTGTSDEAATNFENMLDKFTAKDFTKNATEFGIDVERTMKQAQKNGLSPVLALLDEIRRKAGSDPFKLSKLVPDRQARAAILAILKNWDEVHQQIKDMDTKAGGTMRDFETATGNASAAWDRFFANVSTGAKDLGENLLPGATKAMNYLSDTMEGKDTGLKKANDVAGAALDVLPATKMIKWLFGSEDADKRVMEAYREYGQSRAAAPDSSKKAEPVIPTPTWRPGPMPNTRPSRAERQKTERLTMPPVPVGRPVPVLEPELTGIEKMRRRQEEIRRRSLEQFGDPRRGITPTGGRSDNRIENRINGAFDKIGEEAAAGAKAAEREIIELQIRMYASGNKAGKQLAQGLRSAKPDVSAAASELATEIGNHFPQSPAKKGPLRNLPQMGAKISAQLAAGMTGDSPAKAARTVAGRIAAASAVSGAQPGATKSAGGKGPVTVNVGGITINGVKDAADAADKIALRIERSLAGALADVG